MTKLKRVVRQCDYCGIAIEMQLINPGYPVAGVLVSVTDLLRKESRESEAYDYKVLGSREYLFCTDEHATLGMAGREAQIVTVPPDGVGL